MNDPLGPCQTSIMELILRKWLSKEYAEISAKKYVTRLLDAYMK